MLFLYTENFIPQGVCQGFNSEDKSQNSDSRQKLPTTNMEAEGTRRALRFDKTEPLLPESAAITKQAR